MGILIEMPMRTKPVASAAAVAAETNIQPNEQTPKSGIDFSVWKLAPKERTADYFPTYSTISRAMQTAMRQWVGEWFSAHPEILMRPHTAYPVLVFQATHPFSGKPTNIFTYDIQQTEALNRAFASAASKLGRQLKTLDTKDFPWLTREHYFAYRSKEVVKYVAKNRRAIYKMLNTETMLMDSILKFALIDIPKMGVEEAAILLQKTFATQLRRFSDEFDFSDRAEALLRIATDALLGKLPTEDALPLAA
jgi:hypothetical protein